MPLPNPGGGGLGGGGPLQNVNLGPLIAPPAGMQFLQGLAALPSALEQGMNDATQLRKNYLDMQSTQLQIAQGRWDQGISMIQKNPQLAQSQAMIQYMDQQGRILGFPVPKDSAGHIDDSVWGHEYTDFLKDPYWQEQWANGDSTRRHAIASMFHLVGIPKEAFDVAPMLSAREQNLNDKFKLSETDSAARIKNANMRALALYGPKGLTGAQTYLDYQRAYAQQQEGDAAMIRAQAAMKNANDAVYIATIRANATIKAATIRSSLSGQSIAGIRMQVSSAQQYSRQAHTALNQAYQQLSEAYREGDDANTIKTLTDHVDDMQNKVTTADTELDNMVNNLGGPTLPVLTNQLHSQSTTSQSGKKSATVTTVQTPAQSNAQYQKGKVYVDAQGRRATYLGNGQWQEAPP